jgi:DNA-binding LytR/AlgR family response regulator
LSAEENPSPRTFLSFYQNRIIPIDPRQVAYFHSENEKVNACMFNGDVFPMEKPLNSLMTMVDSSQFFRANRQFLISRRLIREVLIWEGSRLAIITQIAVPEQIIISKERAASFKNWLQGNL